MKNNNFNFIFWGTPTVASDTLEILKEAKFMPSLIITSPDAKKGRGLHIEASPVSVFAEKNNILCLKPDKLDKKFTEKLKPSCLEPNCLFLVVAYGKIIPEKILTLPKLGSINVHYSLLPKYRGASPVESVILNGESITGVTIQKMIYKMDAGDILAQEKINILPDEKMPELRKRLIKLGGKLLLKILPEYIENNPIRSHASSQRLPTSNGIKITPQDENKATYCKKIKKEDGLIDLNDNAIKNYNKFRAYIDWPRTFFFKNDKRVIITKARLESDKFVIEKVIPEGKKEVDYKN